MFDFDYVDYQPGWFSSRDSKEMARDLGRGDAAATPCLVVRGACRKGSLAVTAVSGEPETRGIVKIST